MKFKADIRKVVGLGFNKYATFPSGYYETSDKSIIELLKKAKGVTVVEQARKSSK